LADAHAWAIGHLQSHPGWLLVLDNVEDLDHINDFLGLRSGQGHILVTTRRDVGHARWARLGLRSFHLGALERSDSIRLLAELAGDYFQPEHADGLADALGDLPLALEQAAAYVTQNPGLGLAGYLRLLDQYPAALYADAGVGSRQDRAVGDVWRITMNTIAGRSPLAARILSVLAYLAPDNLPEIVLAPLANEPDRNRALTILIR
jgi:hypothetical protein